MPSYIDGSIYGGSILGPLSLRSMPLVLCNIPRRTKLLAAAPLVFLPIRAGSQTFPWFNWWFAVRALFVSAIGQNAHLIGVLVVACVRRR